MIKLFGTILGQLKPGVVGVHSHVTLAGLSKALDALAKTTILISTSASATTTTTPTTFLTTPTQEFFLSFSLRISLQMNS
jgi:hypothetical protein